MKVNVKHNPAASFFVSTVVVGLLLLSPVASAADSNTKIQRNTIFFVSPPTAQEIGEHLFTEPADTGLSRGITFKDPENSEVQNSVGMPILFHFGKTSIKEESRPFLNSVGEMMVSEQYSDRTLIVEGHTDAVGSEEFNQRLSELRALAIKDYLVTRYGVNPLRLFPAGKGESLLYKPESPKDGVNRRVEFLPYK